MALYIKYRAIPTQEYHVNNIGNISSIDNNHIEYIQADGHELELIQNTFRINGRYTIPMTNERIVKWYGDIAQTIIANLI